MSSNQEQNLKTRLEELEAELRQKQANAQEKVKTVYTEVVNSDGDADSELVAKIYSWLNLGVEKFKSLSPGGKLVVGVAGLWLGITALNFALHLISSLLTVAILGVVLYFAYQKLIVNK